MSLLGLCKENEETSLCSYTPQAAFDKSRLYLYLCGTHICSYHVRQKDPEGRCFPPVLPKRDPRGFSDSPKQATVMHMHRDFSDSLKVTAMASNGRIQQGFEYEIPRLGTHSLRLGASDDFINKQLCKTAPPFCVSCRILNWSNTLKYQHPEDLVIFLP